MTGIFLNKLSEIGRLVNDVSCLIRLVEFAGRKKWHMLFSAIFSVFSEILALAPFVVIYLVIVRLMNPPVDQTYILNLAALAILAVIGRYLCFYVSILFSHVAAADVVYGLRRSVVAHLGKVSMSYFSGKASGSISKVLGDDVERVETFIGHHVPDVVACLTFPTATMLFLLTVDWRLAVASFLPVPIMAWIWISTLYRMTDDRSLPRFHDALEVMNGAIVEYVRGMPVIKVFNQTVWSFGRFIDSVHAVRKFNIDYDTQYIFSWSLLKSAMGSALLFLLPVSIWLFFRGDLDPSVFMLFMIIGIGYMKTLNKVVIIRSMLYRIGEGVARIDRIMAEPEVRSPTVRKIPEGHSIKFNHVSFSYGSKEVLSDVSFEACEGTVTALVGPSGAGKSTVASLVPRLWDAGEGEVLIGDVNVREMPLEVLMDKVAFVFQDVFIFSDTVHENIRMGRDVSREEVIRAAKAAQIHDVIMKLPLGYDTLIGGGGVHLSGGESQRISIARAILKDAPIVLLDEATSFADPDNEAKIKDAFAELLQGKTVLVIAHSLSSITDSDQIIVLDKGRIVGAGRHEELLTGQPLYKKMWDSHVVAKKWTIGGDAA